MREDKATALERLKRQAEQTPRAETGFAFGEGSPDAALMIVGEAPGEREAELGRPFVGAAGRLLESLLQGVEIKRENVWITNVVKSRPTLRKGRYLVNRAPMAGEIAADLPILRSELEIIRPKVILCLGNLAASTLIHKGFKMNEERGKWYEGPQESQALATYHPAYILRQQGEARERLLSLVTRDFEAVRAALDEGEGSPRVRFLRRI